MPTEKSSELLPLDSFQGMTVRSVTASGLGTCRQCRLDNSPGFPLSSNPNKDTELRRGPCVSRKARRLNQGLSLVYSSAFPNYTGRLSEWAPTDSTEGLGGCCRFLATSTCPGTRAGHCSVQTAMPVKCQDKSVCKGSRLPSAGGRIRVKRPLVFWVECEGWFVGNKIFLCSGENG